MSDDRHSLLTYLACSVLTAGIEFVLGWVLLQFFPQSIVVTNVCAIAVSSVVHYALTTRLAFGAKRTAGNALAYALTFVLGLVLQNAIIWACYEHLLQAAPHFLRYVASKGLSLVVPFFVLYYMRKSLNEWLQTREGKNA